MIQVNLCFAVPKQSDYSPVRASNIHNIICFESNLHLWPADVVLVSILSLQFCIYILVDPAHANF